MAETKLLVKVINVTTNLRIRSGAGLSYGIVGRRYNGDTFTATETKESGGITWYKESEGRWSAGNSSSGSEQYIKIEKDLTETPVTPATTVADPVEDDPPFVKPTYVLNSKTVGDSSDLSGYGIPLDGQESLLDGDSSTSNSRSRSKKHASLGRYTTINLNNYPVKLRSEDDGPNVKGTELGYDHNIVIPQDILNQISFIKKALGVPTAYDKKSVNKYSHIYFNRYRMEFPDFYMKNTKGVIFFTKPDLNIFDSSGNINEQFTADDRCFSILKKSKTLGVLLTRDSNTGSHIDNTNFNPMLSNVAQGLEVQDDSVDTIETGETFIGYKMQYAKHNIRSITSGQLSVKFKETHDLAVTSLHQLWVDYESNVYMGSMQPLEKYIWNRELDYACNIYYFLLAEDGETIIFWTKYYGCFPVNVPKSSFSFEYGSEISLPEVSVTYNYIYKSDLSTRALVEFNGDGGNSKISGYNYLKNYNENSIVTGPWADVPYIDKAYINNGIDDSSLVYKLRYRRVNN